MKRRQRAGWILQGVVAAIVLISPAGNASPNLRLHPPVNGCPVCQLWLQYEDIILRAQQEIGPLQDGVLYFYHSDEPSVIEPLIRFAHERSDLNKAIASSPETRERLGGACRHAANADAGITIEISTSARGIFALLTSTSPTTHAMLRSQAGRAVRSKIPVWF